MTRLVLLALTAALLAAPGCGRKGDPERPPDARRVTEPVEVEGDDDRLFGNPPEAPAEPGPEIEEEVDDQLSG